MTIYRRVVTGVSTLILLTRLLCRLQARYGAKIDAWIGERMSPTNAATVRAWIEAFAAVCLILETTPDD
jgi:hypothetical protein